MMTAEIPVNGIYLDTTFCYSGVKIVHLANISKCFVHIMAIFSQFIFQISAKISIFILYLKIIFAKNGANLKLYE